MINLDQDLIDTIFARYGITEPWVTLPATGIVNRIYATEQVVLRIATDHPEGICDARTESVAAPVAHAAGILTPRLIAFDDSRRLIDRPYSLWQRVHGETLGLIKLDQNQWANLWRAVGGELSRLHDRVKVCADPADYLDTPGRELDLHPLLTQLADSGRFDDAIIRSIAALIDELTPHVRGSVTPCFIHNDIHEMNVMCTASGELLAIIDWGDAGWGDPTLEFAAIPLEAIEYALAGYEREAPGMLGDYPAARLIWDKLAEALEAVCDNSADSIPLDLFRQFLQSRA